MLENPWSAVGNPTSALSALQASRLQGSTTSWLNDLTTVWTYLLRLAHGAHRLRVVAAVSPVERTDAADGRAAHEAVETARLVDVVGAARVLRPPAHLHIASPTSSTIQTNCQQGLF